LIERGLEVVEGATRMPLFLCHPQERLPRPLVVFLMDAPGIREELRDMARRLASTGYAVALPDLYHRLGRGVAFDRAKAADPSTGERERMLKAAAALRNDEVVADIGRLLELLERDPAVDASRCAMLGYCMSGRWALLAGARWPERVRAVASYFGTRLVTDAEDSPHRALPKLRATCYFGFAEHDDFVPPQTREAFRDAVASSGIDAKIELYAGTHHGFAFPQSPGYQRAAAERHWETLHALLQRAL